MKTNTYPFHSGIPAGNLGNPFNKSVGRLISLFTLVLVLMATSSSRAQATDKTVAGVVTQSEDGEQLAGVHIQLKGTALGTITDALGKFSFPQKLKDQDVLVFSFVGLKTLEYTITEATPEFIDIQMTYEDFTLVGDLCDDGLFSARKRPLARVWTALKRNR
jgi:hypothetical protein